MGPRQVRLNCWNVSGSLKMEGSRQRELFFTEPRPERACSDLACYMSGAAGRYVPLPWRQSLSLTRFSPCPVVGLSNHMTGVGGCWGRNLSKPPLQKRE